MMKNKKVYKIYNTINKLALKGKDNLMKYQEYVLELVEKGHYSYYLDALSRYFKLDYKDDDDMKFIIEDSWKKIRFDTNPVMSIEIKKIYDKYNVYQMAEKIFRGNDNLYLGTLKEIEMIPPNYNYYIKNNKAARLLGLVNTYIEVHKVNEEEPVLIADQFEEIKDQRNLIKRYELAIIYLLSE